MEGHKRGPGKAFVGTTANLGSVLIMVLRFANEVDEDYPDDILSPRTTSCPQHTSAIVHQQVSHIQLRHSTVKLISGFELSVV